MLESIQKIKDYSHGAGVKPTDDDYIRAGKEILDFIFNCFSRLDVIYPKLKELKIYSSDKLIVKGIVGAGGTADYTVSVAVKEKYGDDFTEDRYIPIHVPSDMIGGATYVIFEIPNSEEDIPRKPSIEFSK